MNRGWERRLPAGDVIRVAATVRSRDDASPAWAPPSVLPLLKNSARDLTVAATLHGVPAGELRPGARAAAWEFGPALDAARWTTPDRYGVCRQSAATTALWLKANPRPRVKAVSCFACHRPKSLILSMNRWIVGQASSLSPGLPAPVPSAGRMPGETGWKPVLLHRGGSWPRCASKVGGGGAP